jgi:electron transfer flavoprotein beta subunit
MTVPETIVCLKVVPRPEEVSVDPETLTLDRGAGRSMINPADMNALETALALKDRYGGTVRLLAMGPPLFEDYLRLGLAMGADEAFLLSDRAFGGADTLATSYTLAAGVRRIGHFDLILCGEESSDGATGQVPPGMAEWLDIPQITYAIDVTLVDSRWRLKAKREVRGGHETLVAPLPVLVSVKARVNEPRFIDMDRWERGADAPVTIWSAADLDVDPEMIGSPGSPTLVAGTREAPRRERRHEMIDGTPQRQARVLAQRISPYVQAPPTNGREVAASDDGR